MRTSVVSDNSASSSRKASEFGPMLHSHGAMVDDSERASSVAWVKASPVRGGILLSVDEQTSGTETSSRVGWNDEIPEEHPEEDSGDSEEEEEARSGQSFHKDSTAPRAFPGLPLHALFAFCLLLLVACVALMVMSCVTEGNEFTIQMAVGVAIAVACAVLLILLWDSTARNIREALATLTSIADLDLIDSDGDNGKRTNRSCHFVAEVTALFEKIFVVNDTLRATLPFMPTQERHTEPAPENVALPVFSEILSVGQDEEEGVCNPLDARNNASTSLSASRSVRLLSTFTSTANARRSPTPAAAVTTSTEKSLQAALKTIDTGTAVSDLVYYPDGVVVTHFSLSPRLYPFHLVLFVRQMKAWHTKLGPSSAYYDPSKNIVEIDESIVTQLWHDIVALFVDSAIDAVMANRGVVIDVSPSSVTGVWFKISAAERKACTAAHKFTKRFGSSDVIGKIRNLLTYPSHDALPADSIPASVGVSVSSGHIGSVGNEMKCSFACEADSKMFAAIYAETGIKISAPIVACARVRERAKMFCTFRPCEVLSHPRQPQLSLLPKKTTVQMPPLTCCQFRIASQKAPKLAWKAVLSPYGGEPFSSSSGSASKVEVVAVAETLYQCVELKSSKATSGDNMDEEWMYMLQKQEAEEAQALQAENLAFQFVLDSGPILPPFGSPLAIYHAAFTLFTLGRSQEALAMFEDFAKISEKKNVPLEDTFVARKINYLRSASACPSPQEDSTGWSRSSLDAGTTASSITPLDELTRNGFMESLRHSTDLFLSEHKKLFEPRKKKEGGGAEVAATVAGLPIHRGVYYRGASFRQVLALGGDDPGTML